MNHGFLFRQAFKEMPRHIVPDIPVFARIKKHRDPENKADPDHGTNSCKILSQQGVVVKRKKV
jgi:hypothetical protein